MFEQLPFYNGRILNYKQFFYYMIFLVILSLFVVCCITDIALNLALWYQRKHKPMFIPLEDDEDQLLDAEERKSELVNKVRDNYLVEEEAKINLTKNRKTFNPSDSQSHEGLEMEEMRRKEASEEGDKMEETEENELLNKENKYSLNPMVEDDEEQPPQVVKKIKILHYVILVFELIMAGLVLLFWDITNAFGFFYAGAISLILKSFFVIGLFVLGYFRYCRLFSVSPKYRNPNVPWAMKIVVLIIFVVGVFLFNLGVMTAVKGLCIANHNNEIPGITLGEYAINTALMRSWSPDIWPNKPEPWFVYSTLPEDALKSTFINFHINPDSWPKGEWSPKCLIGLANSVPEISQIQFWATFNAVDNGYEYPSHEYGKRKVYTWLITGLDYGSIFSVKIDQEGWNSPTSKTYYYENFRKDDVVIVNGGDIGNVKEAEMIHTNVLGKMDFDVIFVGGDISYDNGISEWYQCYDHLLNRLPHQKTNSETGFIRLIPLMFSIGNHDVGVNSNSGHKIKRSNSQPVFYHFYPQNTHNGEVPNIHNRTSYLAHEVGNDILFLSLDTGYDVSMKDQTKWIEAQLSKDFKYKFVQYHHPFYSACTKGEKYGVAKEGREEWVPLFDKYGVTMVFENHVHGFKRTKPLKGNSVSPKEGIIYIGDGSWGPLLSSWKPANQDLMEKASKVHHVWILKLKSNGEIDVKAYGAEGEVIDEFSKMVN